MKCIPYPALKAMALIAMLCGLAFPALLLAGGPGLAQQAGGAQLPPGVQNALSLARDDIQAKRFRQAINRLNPLIGNEAVPGPVMAAAFLLRGAAYQGLRQDKTALSDFNDALWLEALPAGFRAQTHSLRAQSLMVLGRHGEALADARLAESLDPRTRQYAELRQAIEKFRADNPAGTASIGTDQASRDAAEAVRSVLGGGPAPARTASSGDRTATTGSISPDNAPKPESGRAYAIQLGAMNSDAMARAEWQRIQRAHAQLLGGLTPEFRPGAKSGSLVRLQAGPAASMEDARALCGKLQARGQDCFAVRR